MTFILFLFYSSFDHKMYSAVPRGVTIVNKINASVTEDPFWDLHLSASNGPFKPKFMEKRVGFNFFIVAFPYLDGDVSRSTSYGVY